MVFESRSFTATTEFFADGRFAETLEYFTFVWRAGGSYDYVPAGPHAGRVTAVRDDGDVCAVDMYFASRSGGRFATRCAGAAADDLWFGGRWHVEGGQDDGSPAQTDYGVNDALPGVPTSGLFAPADVSGGSARASGGSTTIDLDDGGYFDLNDGTRYTCASAGGCEIVDGTVTRGSVTGRVSGSGGGEADDEGSLALNFEWLLDDQNSSPEGITYADGRFYVPDGSDDKVYAYSVAGARDASADFELHDDGGVGIAYGDGRFYVLDYSIDMVRVYPGPSEPVRQVTGASPNFPAGSGPGNQDYTVGTAIDDLLLPAATGGDGPLTYSLTPGVPGLIFDATATVRRLSGTPTTAGTYDMTFRARDVDGDTDSLKFTIAVTDPGGGGGTGAPDLTVGSVSVSDSNPVAGASFTLRATVRNSGDASAVATTLRYYRSTNVTISRSDTQVGTDSVGGLSASGTSAESITLPAPSSAGTYYYGACADSVAGESDTDNNCSTGVRVSVTGGGGGGGGDDACVEVNDVIELGEGESCTITQALVDKYSLNAIVRAGVTATCSGGTVTMSNGLRGDSIFILRLTIRCR